MKFFSFVGQLDESLHSNTLYEEQARGWHQSIGYSSRVHMITAVFGSDKRLLIDPIALNEKQRPSQIIIHGASTMSGKPLTSWSWTYEGR